MWVWLVLIVRLHCTKYEVFHYVFRNGKLHFLLILNGKLHFLCSIWDPQRSIQKGVHCVKSVHIRNYSGLNFPAFGPEQCRIRTLFTQWTFTEEILNGKLHFLCNATNDVESGKLRWRPLFKIFKNNLSQYAS